MEPPHLGCSRTVILSKALLQAEDDKIKDPTIVSQLTRDRAAIQ